MEQFSWAGAAGDEDDAGYSCRAGGAVGSLRPAGGHTIPGAALQDWLRWQGLSASRRAL